jgi:hypothetical protein
MSAADLTTSCPIEGCEARKGADKLYCKRHWFMVPSPLRTAIWDTWRRRRDPGSLAAYRANVEKARIIIAEKEAPHQGGLF